MENFIITQAVAVLLQLLKDKKRAKQWLPALRKVKTALDAVLGG